MPLYLTKVLEVLALPLGWVLLLGVTALSLTIFERKRAAGWVLGAALALLWVCAMPFTAFRLTHWLESGYPPVRLEETPVADVAIVLGGAVGSVGEPPVENLTGASDRVLRAARLYRAGKADWVFAVGGNLPWLGGARPEAELVRDLLVEWGVPGEAILLETTSRSTRDNAVFAAEFAASQGWEKLLLVTSASHMARAVGAFRAAGLDVIPSPTDYAIVPSVPMPLDILDFLPTAGALAQTSKAMHEVIGRRYYRWRGWLR